MRLIDKKLCPLKVKPQSPTTGAIEFDVCDGVQCEWWQHNVDGDEDGCIIKSLGWLKNVNK